MSGNPYQNYLESEVLSADPVKLVELLYRGACDAVELARRHLRAGDIMARGRAITKASNILAELLQTLDVERGGELARNLREVYDYLLRRLSQAHLEQNEEALTECARLLATLLEGWQSCQVRYGPPEPVEAGERLAVSY